MNIPLSLLIYNPIEVYTLVLLCDIIIGNDVRLNKKNVTFIYLLGFVNFVVQEIPNFWYGELEFLLFNLLFIFVISPFTLKYFYYKVSGKIVRHRIYVISVSISCIVIMLTTIILDFFSKSQILFYNNWWFSEFVSNIIIFTIQIPPYILIKKRGCHYEKCCKRNCKRSNC